MIGNERAPKFQGFRVFFCSDIRVDRVATVGRECWYKSAWEWRTSEQRPPPGSTGASFLRDNSLSFLRVLSPFAFTRWPVHSFPYSCRVPRGLRLCQSCAHASFSTHSGMAQGSLISSAPSMPSKPSRQTSQSRLTATATLVAFQMNGLAFGARFQAAVTLACTGGQQRPEVAPGLSEYRDPAADPHPSFAGLRRHRRYGTELSLWLKCTMGAGDAAEGG